MTANNETGVIQPVADVVDVGAPAGARRRRVHRRGAGGAIIDLAEVTAGADLVGVSAHKVGGPVGRRRAGGGPRVALVPRQHGGGQERERRSGTQDVAGAVGMATAMQLVAKERAAALDSGGGAAGPPGRGALAALPWAHRDGAAGRGVPVLPGHLHLCLPGVEREELLVALGAEGVCVSGGSSCASGALEPSHVLAAMGVEPGLAAGAVRFSLGYETSDAEVDRALAVVPGVAVRLRRAV